MRAIREAVHDTNAAIDQALTGGAPPRSCSRCSRPSISPTRCGRLFNLYPTNELLDLAWPRRPPPRAIPAW